MALTPSQRNQIASYKIQIEGYRKNLQILKEQKKVNIRVLCISN